MRNPLNTKNRSIVNDTPKNRVGAHDDRPAE